MGVARPDRVALRVAVVSAVLAAAGCAAEAMPTPTPKPRPELILPADDERLSGGATVATPWTDMGVGPAGFDADASFPEPRDASRALVDALPAQIGAANETEGLLGESDRELLLVSESGFGDDSVAGVQYLLLLQVDGREWRIEDIWTRVLCRRGVHEDLCV